MGGRGRRTFAGARSGPALAVFATLVVAVLAVLGAEALLGRRDPGLLWRDPVTGDDSLQFYRFHPGIGLFHKPGYSGEYRGIRYTMNERGLRGAEVDYVRVPGRSRILLVGDDVVWGLGVPDGETIADFLERLRPESQVLNLGVGDFGTAQELVLLQQEGLRYRPDLVVLVFTLANDVEDSYFPRSAASYPTPIFYLAEDGLRMLPFELDPWDRLWLWLSHNSYLARTLFPTTGGAVVEADPADEDEGAPRSSNPVWAANRARLAAARVDLEPFAGLRYLVPAGPAESRHYARRGGLLPPTALSHYKVELVKQLLLAAAAASREAGADFVVVLAPFEKQLDPDDLFGRNPLSQELRRFLASQAIPTIDLLPELIESGRGEALFLDGVHFSVDGNLLVAEILARDLSPAPRAAAD